MLLLVASETGHVYTFATRKLQPMITSETGKALIQTCLNSPDSPPRSDPSSDQRMSATGFEETDLTYQVSEADGCSEVAKVTANSQEGSEVWRKLVHQTDHMTHCSSLLKVLLEHTTRFVLSQGSARTDCSFVGSVRTDLLPDGTLKTAGVILQFCS